jgi:hypothetical protein
MNGLNNMKVISNQKNCYAIADTNLKLIKYFISSNVALKELKNRWLRELISIELLPGPHSFHKRILPAVYEKLRQEIELRLKESSSICLLTELWCNFQKHGLYWAMCFIDVSMV